jgi:hypothetical protein
MSRPTDVVRARLRVRLYVIRLPTAAVTGWADEGFDGACMPPSAASEC